MKPQADPTPFVHPTLFVHPSPFAHPSLCAHPCPFTLSLSKGRRLIAQGFDPSTGSGQAKLSPNGCFGDSFIRRQANLRPFARAIPFAHPSLCAHPSPFAHPSLCAHPSPFTLSLSKGRRLIAQGFDKLSPNGCLDDSFIKRQADLRPFARAIPFACPSLFAHPSPFTLSLSKGRRLIAQGFDKLSPNGWVARTVGSPERWGRPNVSEVTP